MEIIAIILFLMLMAVVGIHTTDSLWGASVPFILVGFIFIPIYYWPIIVLILGVLFLSLYRL